MAKFLLLIALVIVVYLLFRGFRRAQSQQQPSPPQSPPQRTPSTGEDMVRCTVCGVNLPRSESFISRGKFFCSDEHRRLGVDRSSNG